MQNVKVCFDSDDLIRKITNNFRPNRFQVNFILVNGIEHWADVIKKLKFNVDYVVNLSTYCRNENSFPNLRDLLNELRKLINTYNRILVLPLGEYLKLNEDSHYILSILAQFSENGLYHRKIYIPLLNVENVFFREISKVNRFLIGLLPEIYKIEGNEISNLKIFSEEELVKENKGIVLKGIKKYFEFWENDASKEINLITNWANYLKTEDIHGSIEVTFYKDAYDVLCELYGDIKKIPKNYGDLKQWKWLLKKCNSINSLEDTVSEILNIKALGYKAFINWKHLDENERWLLWLWNKIKAPEGSYLKLLAESSISLEDFLEKIVNIPFERELNFDLIKERNKLIEYIGINSLPNSFWERYKALEEPEIKLKVLTSRTYEEKKEIVLNIGKLIKKGIEIDDEWKDYLLYTFPELHFYLSPFKMDDDFLESYFREYKISRIMDEASEELLKMVSDVADSSKIWRFDTRNKILNEVRNGSIIIWVDGLGIEWLSLICNYIVDKYDNIELDVRIGRAMLPSTTFHNSFEREENDIFINELDKVAHSYDYKFPDAFLKEIEVIKDIVDNYVIYNLEKNSKIIITSDHGLSRFAIKGDKYICTKDILESRKWGRFAEVIRDGALDVCEYKNDKFIIEDKYILLKGYGRFSSEGGVIGEVHGGATLEEVLVPIIVIERVKKGLEVIVRTPQVSYNRKGEAELIVEANKKLQILRLFINEEEMQGKLIGVNKWRFTLKGFKPGKYFATLFEKEKIATINFEILPAAIYIDDLGL